MQITSLHNTNTGFKATLDVSSVKLNKTRWNSIAKIFNEESKSIPNGLLRVFHDEKQCCLIGYTDKGAHTLRNSILADLSTETGNNLLEKITDNIIAETFIKFLKFGVKADDEIRIARNAFFKFAGFSNENDCKRNARRIFDERCDAINKSVKEKAREDEIIKEWYVSI